MDRIPLEPKPEGHESPIRPYNNVVQEAIKAAKQAEELKGAAITQLLSLRDQIDSDLRTLGYEPPAVPPARNRGGQVATSPEESELKRAPGPRPFRDMDLASVGRIILSEQGGGPMHGKEIEKLAKAGGYDKGGKHWQGYLAIALKRAGGFENTGLNNWRLNNQIAPVPIGRKLK